MLRYGEEEELAFEDFTVESRNPFTVRISTILLGDEDPRLTEFQETTTRRLGTISSVQVNTVGEPTEEQMDGVLDIINRRVNLFGTEEPIIQRFGDDRIIVQLPGAGGAREGLHATCEPSFTDGAHPDRFLHLRLA